MPADMCYLKHLLICVVFVGECVPAIQAQETTTINLVQSVAQESAQFQRCDLQLTMTALVAANPPTMDEISRRIVSIQESIDQSIAEHSTNSEHVERLRKARTEGVASWTEQIKANSAQSILFSWRISGPLFGGDRLVEFRIRRGSEEKYSAPTTLLSRTLDEHRARNFFYESSNRTAVASANKIMAGIEDPALFGRLPVALAEISAYELELEERASGDDSVIDSSTQFVAMYSTVKGERVKVARVGIAVIDSHYVCPLIEMIDKASNSVHRRIAWDYFKCAGDGLLYPGKWRSEAGIRTRPEQFVKTDITVDQTASRISSTASPVALKLSLPAGTGVISTGVPGQSDVSYTTKCELLVGIDDLDRLGSMPCIEVAKAVVVSSPEEFRSSSRNVSRWVIVLNVVLAGIGLIFWRRWRKSSASKTTKTLTLLLPVAMLCGGGCSGSSNELTTLSVNPETIDLGIVCAGQVLPLEFTISNPQNQSPLAVEIHAGCGCMEVSPTNFVLNPGENQTISGSISSHGKEGVFRSALTCVAREADGGSVSKDVFVEAQVNDTVFCLPNRLVLASDGGDARLGTTVLHFPNEWAAKITCVLNHPDGMVTMINGTEISSLTGSCAAVSVTLPLQSIAPAGLFLSVMLDGQRMPIIRIPVVME